LVEEWEVVAPKHGITHIVHIGAEAIADVQDLAAHAAAHGAEAVGVMPPVFFKPATIEALGAWVEAAAAACPHTPTYYYHIPSQTGVLFDMYDLVVEMDRRGVSNFAGVKYTGLYETRAFPDMMRAAAYKKGAYQMLGGREELMVEAQAIGVAGFIGSQFNYGGDIYGQIATETDVDTKNAKQLSAIELLLGWINGVPAGVDGNKMLVNLAGVPVGPARMPSLIPTAEDYSSLASVVVGWCDDDALGGLFEPQPLICASQLLRKYTLPAK
jgi:N-acetylneuraminate lyase